MRFEIGSIIPPRATSSPQHGSHQAAGIRQQTPTFALLSVTGCPGTYS